MSVRTRFAPSPTGFLHVGGVRTALFAWAYARNQDGSFILRIEDTDKKREVKGATKHIMESLSWLGLEWDEGPDKGQSGPYLQSERRDVYQRYAKALIDAGHAYADPYSPDEVERFRNEAKAAKRPFIYRNHRPESPPEWDGTRPLRFKIPEVKRYQWHDEVRGALSAGEEALDDFVLIKADGFPTYNFAHVVDDHEMQISHVMRGEEFIASVPIYLALHDALGWQYPKFVTLPPILSPQGGKKLSKRDGAEDILTYREQGYLPEAIVNYLASLGWNDGTEQEVFTPEEIVAKFSLERIQKGGARFDRDKLDWLNWEHVKRKIDTDFESLVEHLVANSNFVTRWKNNEDKDYLRSAYRLAATKSRSTDELRDQVQIFTAEPAMDIESLQLDVVDKGLTREKARKFIEAAAERLAKQPAKWQADDIEAALRSRMQELEAQPREFLNLVRLIISGRTVSPDLFEMVELLGQEQTVKRLENSLKNR